MLHFFQRRSERVVILKDRGIGIRGHTIIVFRRIMEFRGTRHGWGSTGITSVKTVFVRGVLGAASILAAWEFLRRSARHVACNRMVATLVQLCWNN